MFPLASPSPVMSSPRLSSVSRTILTGPLRIRDTYAAIVPRVLTGPLGGDVRFALKDMSRKRQARRHSFFLVSPFLLRCQPRVHHCGICESMRSSSGSLSPSSQGVSSTNESSSGEERASFSAGTGFHWQQEIRQLHLHLPHMVKMGGMLVARQQSIIAGNNVCKITTHVIGLLVAEKVRFPTFALCTCSGGRTP